jgi:murein DD-endopeptidase MepM/ murein hydrolase activator NlpD
VRKINYVKADGKANGAPLGVFGAPRKASSTCPQGRKHAGVDMPAEKDAEVRAIADGVIVATQGWSGPGTRALLVEHTIGGKQVVVLYGAVAPGSYAAKGTAVKAGETIARIGVYPHGSTMLHVEAYTDGTRRNYRWCSGKPAPSRLLDVTSLLLRLSDVDPA